MSESKKQEKEMKVNSESNVQLKEDNYVSFVS
jgi:hypothetical protein